MADAVVMRDNMPNYAGLLFRKGNAAVPFSSLIGAPETTNHNEFSCGTYFDTEDGEQPEISEKASLTAPDAKSTGRTQTTNVTQIFQEKVSISYAKMSDMGTLSGINVANAVANPSDERAFQIARRMDKIAKDIEYSFVRGTYQKATSSDVAAKTMGIMEAIKTNVINVGTAETPAALTYWTLAKALVALRDAGADVSKAVFIGSAAAILQLNKDAAENQYRQDTITEMGLDLQRVVTPLGTIKVALVDTLNAKKAETYNNGAIVIPELIHPVYQPVPGKGNFFYEELAKTGAAESGQIFGQVGLDFGPEYYYAKLQYISNDLPTGTL